MKKFRQNIFGIGEVYELQKEGQWIDRTRETYREYGYFGGGYGPGNSTRVERVDYSNDTTLASIRGPLSYSLSGQSSTGNSNFGYFSGGSNNIISRIDYSNDSTIASARGALSKPGDISSAVGNSNFGYFNGGRIPGGGYIGTTSIDRLNYSSDLSNALIRGAMTSLRLSTAATGNSNFGWISGGSYGIGTPSTIYFSTVDRIQYANDTLTALVRGPLGIARSIVAGGEMTATGNNNFGYFGGGGSSGGIGINRFERIDYSNDLVAASFRIATTIGVSGAATGNSNFGYFKRGTFTYISRVDYSNDTVQPSVRGPSTSTRRSLSATSSASFGGSPVSYLGAPWVATAPFGYFGGGATPSVVSTVDRISYTDDTTTALIRGPLTVARSNLAATGNNNFGYFLGGLVPGTPTPTTISMTGRLDYSNDTNTISSRGNLLVADSDFSATGTSRFAYIAGSRGGTSTTNYRLDYSNDFVNVVSRGTLSGARRYNAAITSPNFGYFGGNSVSVQSLIDRLDYSNDTATTTTRGPLSQARFSLAGTSNNNFGYYGGGSTPSIVSTVDRVDFATDTNTASVRGPLSSVRTQSAATGNSGFGYFGGGAVPGLVSSVERVDYSNDTQITSTRGGALTSARNLLADTSSQVYGGVPNTTVDPLPTYVRAATQWTDRNTLDLPFKRVLGSFGYFGGGGDPASISNIQRIDYSNDLALSAIRGNLTRTVTRPAGTGNSNFGYYAGGTLSNNTSTSTIDRIDYSNDSSNLLARTTLTSARQGSSGFGNNLFGYFAGSFFNNNFVSFVERIDYSNDSLIATNRTFLSITKGLGAATGNFNFGYFGGGTTVPPSSVVVSTVERINYSNDTQKVLIRGPLSLARTGPAATGNSNFGYFGGGGPGPRSIIDRLNYSNDTATASVRGPLSSPKVSLAATGNNNFGYFGGGDFIGNSRVDRTDYSNDTVTASVRGPLSIASLNHTASTNARSS